MKLLGYLKKSLIFLIINCIFQAIFEIYRKNIMKSLLLIYKNIRPIILSFILFFIYSILFNYVFKQNRDNNKVIRFINRNILKTTADDQLNILTVNLPINYLLGTPSNPPPPPDKSKKKKKK